MRKDPQYRVISRREFANTPPVKVKVRECNLERRDGTGLWFVTIFSDGSASVSNEDGDELHVTKSFQRRLDLVDACRRQDVETDYPAAALPGGTE